MSNELNIGPIGAALMAQSIGMSGLIRGSRLETADIYPINSQSPSGFQARLLSQSPSYHARSFEVMGSLVRRN